MEIVYREQPADKYLFKTSNVILFVESKKAFVFSLDAFIAFTLSIAAIYSLIFFSSIPSAYYSSLTQAHFLARDSLISLATSSPPNINLKTNGMIIVVPLCENGTALDCALLDGGNAKAILDPIIPKQFGYTLERDGEIVYDTTTDGASDHNHNYRKVKASAQMLYFSESPKRNIGASPYCYNTCNGRSSREIEVYNPVTGQTRKITVPYCPTPCDQPAFTFDPGGLNVTIVKLTVFI